MGFCMFLLSRSKYKCFKTRLEFFFLFVAKIYCTFLKEIIINLKG